MVVRLGWWRRRARQRGVSWSRATPHGDGGGGDAGRARRGWDADPYREGGRARGDAGAVVVGVRARVSRGNARGCVWCAVCGVCGGDDVEVVVVVVRVLTKARFASSRIGHARDEATSG